MTDLDLARWRRRLIVTQTCAVWAGAVGRDGYGRFSYRYGGAERTVTPHQVAAWLAARDGGPGLTAGSTVLHDCEVRLCCTTGAGHVRVATQAENMRQAAQRGRAVGPRPGRVDIRGPLGLSRAIQTGLRAHRDRSPAGLARALAGIVAAGDPGRSQLGLFSLSTADATAAAART